MKQILLVVFLLFTSTLFAQKNDSTVIREIFDEVLVNGKSHSNLRVLCKSVGARLSGSPEAAKAVEWGEKVLKQYGFDKVYLQEIMVPHWTRGSKEGAMFMTPDGKAYTPSVCALGGSVGTNGRMEAEVIEVHNFEELDLLGKEKIEGKFIFYNRPMEPRNIDTFESYGGCVDQRYAGASKASKYGAVGVLVRSMSLHTDRHPHTGSMGYEDGIKKIPSAAIGTQDADYLSGLLKRNKSVKVSLNMDCKTLPDVKSYNVIAEIKGSKYPDKIIAVGGHLDSWDLGEGAHDDGAGVVQSIEVLRTFKALGIRPQHTIRCILFMNEENGNNGGKTYAKVVGEKKEVHVAALESDRGGFVPRGFSIDGDGATIKEIQKWKDLLKPYNLHIFVKGYGGVDINPLKGVDKEITLIGLLPDSQRYFDFHHAPTDVFENVNKRELELGAGSMTALIYLIDKYGLGKSF
jgi:carboxypeptidase Q